MAHRFGMLRRFRFNLPQRIAAALLALFSFRDSGSSAARRSPTATTSTRAAAAKPGKSPRPSPATTPPAATFTTAFSPTASPAFPLTLNLLVERGFDLFRNPENRVVQADVRRRSSSTWELRHQMTHILLLLRLPFLFAGCALGGCIWWVTRRLYGNLGGYTALALYCFSPAVLKACVAPNPDVLAALGVFGGVYTCIGVAHAMQGPRRKVASAHRAAHRHLRRCGSRAHRRASRRCAAGPCRHALDRRRPPEPALPVVLAASAGGLVLLFACYGFSPDAFSYVFRSSAGFLWFSTRPCPPFLLDLRQRRRYAGRLRRRRALSRRAQVALLRQHRSSTLRRAPHAPRHDRCPAAPGSGRCRFCSPLSAASLPTLMKARADAWRSAPAERSSCSGSACILSLPLLSAITDNSRSSLAGFALEKRPRTGSKLNALAMPIQAQNRASLRQPCDRLAPAVEITP